MFVHSCFSPLWHFHLSSLCFENGPWSLGIATRAFSRTLFVSFHSVSFLYCLGYFSFLCLENCPWKLSKGAFSRTLFDVFFVFVSFWHDISNDLTPQLPSLEFQLVIRPRTFKTRTICVARANTVSARESHDVFIREPLGVKNIAQMLGVLGFAGVLRNFWRELLQIFFLTTFLFGGKQRNNKIS